MLIFWIWIFKNSKIHCSELFDKVEAVIINTNEANCENNNIFLTTNDHNYSNFIVNSNDNQTLFRCNNFTSLNNWIQFLCKKLNTCLKNSIFSNIYKKNYLTNNQNNNLSELEKDYLCSEHNLRDKSFKFYHELTSTAEQTTKEINNFIIDKPKNNTIYESSFNLIEDDGLRSTNSNIIFNIDYDFTNSISIYTILYISLFLLFFVVLLTCGICFYKSKKKFNPIPSNNV